MPSLGDSFIERYVHYAENQESPDNYWFWSAVTAIASTLGRQVWLDQAYFKVYPNQYVVFVSGSASCRKGVPIKTARDFAARFDFGAERRRLPPQPRAVRPRRVRVSRNRLKRGMP